MTRAIEQALSLVPVSKPKSMNPIVQRRSRLLKSIRRQQMLGKRTRQAKKPTGHGSG
jgi:heme exporter protein D